MPLNIIKRTPMDKVALLIIYNHRYDKNISVLNKLYESKFTYIYHIIPFYDGDEGNVIPVYESSYNFQGYISQAYTHLKKMEFTHFLIVADDLLLNPHINEITMWDSIGITKSDSFIPIEHFRVLQKQDKYWEWTINAMKYKVNKKGVEINKILPSVDVARKRFDKFLLPYSTIPWRILFKADIVKKIKLVLSMPWSRKLNYPLTAGYSDIFLITADVMPEFATYCGAFAATDLFVEIAIPTALVLSADHIKFDKDLKLHYGAMWPYDGKMECLVSKYRYNLNELLTDFPADKLFLHPIKLSKWK